MDAVDHADDDYDWEAEERLDYANASTAGIEVIGGSTIYYAMLPLNGGDACKDEVHEHEYRVIDQYEAARRRQADALCLAERRWKKPPPEPDPADLTPAETLSGRQEEFCRHYAAKPVAAHAALLAGYGEESARNQGARLLKNPLVLARIEALRAERGVHHTLEAGTLQDKIESVFVDALTANHHAAAVAALRLQAGLARLPTRPTTREEARATASAAEDAKPAVPQRDTPTEPKPKADKSRGRTRKKPTKADK